ncbi:DUF1294 domain-containing protein [Prevotella koreensis]|uniref:DUF1294 domain-containing protein n=1 Tax=Prevotella koreensis TaxID=2490854 RepID=UPI001EF066A2|nr:DUF1294 domain-containing protein [Prevotella koreensis]
MLILAVIGGSFGALLGMKIWHHKTMNNKFKYGLPLILLVKITIIYMIKKRHIKNEINNTNQNYEEFQIKCVDSSTTSADYRHL